MAADSPVIDERRNGLTTALNIVVAPKEAFETLRVVPMWGWAFLIAVVLAVAGSYLALPAQIHASQANMAHMYATDPRFAQMSDAQKAQSMKFGMAIASVSPFLAPIYLLIAGAIGALILLLVNAIGHGKGTFKQFWAAMINCSIVTYGLFAIVQGIVVRLHGPETYNRPLDIFMAMPSLAWLAPNAAPKTVAFLAAIHPFTIWGFVLTVMTLTIIGRVAKAPAYIGAAIFFLVGAFFYTMGVQG